ncbi:hypothetical protein CK203_058392 [Vitis vinifera]|uniref:Uncharacterized protein n=1 Tax=Vitis vinifera TaxID=29760 RepID=A0A438GI56_VITVI|nr:hypothetical protein CK203_058392 [Vitis vinifera]
MTLSPDLRVVHAMNNLALVVVYMKKSESSAQGSAHYEQLKDVDDMNESRALDAMNNSGLWLISMILGRELKDLVAMNSAGLTLEHELKALDAINNSGFYLKSMTPSCELKALHAQGYRCYEQLRAMDDINLSRCYEWIKVVVDMKNSESSSLSFTCYGQLKDCLVLLPEGVQIGERATCLLGNPDGVAPDSDASSGSSRGGVPTPCNADGHPCDVPSSLDIPHPKFCPADVPLSLDISHPAPDAGWERRAFQLPRSDISGSSDSAYPESFATILHSAAIQSNSEDFSSEDERLGSSSLGVKKAGTTIKGHHWTRIKWHHCQGPLRGHESAETPIGNESNGAVAGDGATLHCACHIEYEIAEEAMNFMSYVAEVSRGWDEPNARIWENESQPNAKGEMYILNDGIDMKAKIAAMARRLEELEMKKMQEVQAISQTPLQAMPCAICLSYEHLVEECPTIPTEGNPPQYKQHAQALQQASNLEQAMMNLSKVVGDFVGAKKSINAQLSQRIDSVESLPTSTRARKRKLSFSTYQNSKGIHEVEAQKGESSMVKEVKTVITLRSGKEVDLPTSKLEHKVESETEKEKREEIKGKRKGEKFLDDQNQEECKKKVKEEVGNQEELKKQFLIQPTQEATTDASAP